MEDKIDIYVKRILNEKISKPASFEYTINNFNNKEKKVNLNLFFKLATVMACLAIVGTTSFATTTLIKKKIWKEPKLITKEERKLAENKVKEKITENERKEFINETEAIEKANIILEKIGCIEKLESCELIRDYNENIHYRLANNNIMLNLDPYNGKLEYFSNNQSLKNEDEFDVITSNEAKRVAIDIYKKLGLYNDEDEILEVENYPMTFENKSQNVWVVSFGEKVNDLKNLDSKYSICFNVKNSTTIIYMIKAKEDNNMELNQVIIGKEEAIKIAKNKEKEFSTLEISDVNAELSIKKMNLFIYYLENNIDNGNLNYKINNISRIVWVVEIVHNKDCKPKEFDLQSVKKMYNKKYYIDAETGEIIGGEQSEYFK